MARLNFPTVRWLDINAHRSVGTVFSGLVIFHLTVIQKGEQIGQWMLKIQGDEVFSFGPYKDRDEAKSETVNRLNNLLSETGND